MQENQTLWRSRRSTATVKSKSEVKRLIFKHFEIVVDFLMHISGLKIGWISSYNLWLDLLL